MNSHHHSVLSIVQSVVRFIWRYFFLGILTHFYDKPSRGLLAFAILGGLWGLDSLPHNLPAWLGTVSPEMAANWVHIRSTISFVCAGASLIFLFYLSVGVDQLQQLRSKNTQLAERMTAIRSMGQEGEVETTALVQSLRDKMHFLHRSTSWMPADEGIADIVLLDKSKTHSQEVDELIVVDNHVFVIEVKHWQGSIRAQGDQLLVNGELRKSPEAQSRSKLERIRQQFLADDVDAEVYPLYVFTHPHVELDTELPWNYVKLSNLDGYFKFMRKEVWQQDLDHILAQHLLSETTKSLMKLIDKRPDAKHHHLLFLASRPNPGEQLVEYADLYRQFNENQQRIDRFDLEALFKAVLYWLLVSMIALTPLGWMVTSQG